MANNLLAFNAANTPSKVGDPQASCHLTDAGNAQRLVIRHGHNLQFCYGWKDWLVWDGKRFKVDFINEAERCAKETALSIYDEETAWDYREFIKWAKSSQSRGHLNAMVELAKTEPGIPVTPDVLDADPWLLNCNNGVLDLRRSKLREHRREDLCTKLVNVDFDPTATCPLFENFLNRIMNNNPGLIKFLQRSVGYSLTGSTKEQVVFILHGGGANGKTTLLEVIRTLFEDYAKTANADLLLTKKSDGVRSDVARLAGARLVTTGETEADRQLAEALVKQLTGGDTITARFLYREFFEFKSTFKVFLATNHRPNIRGGDKGIWRRIRLIPFEVTIPDKEQDKELKEKLLNELPGILGWAVRGCLDWQDKGLDVPLEISAAVEAYRQESDAMGTFIEECCEPNIKTPTRELYWRYKEWAKQVGEKVLTQREFGMQLAERGFKPTRDGRKRYRLGIGLRKEGGMVTHGDAGDAR